MPIASTPPPLGFTPDVPGRGAWTLKGGLLPVKPGSTSRAGYYRLAATGEIPVGSVGYLNRAATHSDRVVFLGVQAIQQLCGMTGADVDGWFGPATDKAVRDVQTRARIAVDGIVGRGTMRALVEPVVNQLANLYGVPVRVLGGIAVNESALDPAAVGTNGLDTGLCQINLGAHPDVSVEDACAPHVAFSFTGADLKAVRDRWVGKTKVDPMVIAVANHNNPALAKRWALDPSGKPPYVEGRLFQINEYVDKVMSAW